MLPHAVVSVGAGLGPEAAVHSALHWLPHAPSLGAVPPPSSLEAAEAALEAAAGGALGGAAGEARGLLASYRGALEARPLEVYCGTGGVLVLW